MIRINRRKLSLCILSVGALAASVALAEDVWIKTDNVQVRAGKGPVYKSLLTLNKGDKIAVDSHEGKWLKTKVGDKDGYVYEDSISPDKISGGGNALVNLDDASKADAANAAKGLNPEAEDYAKDKNADPSILQKLIDAKKDLNGDEQQQFETEGKVGNAAP